jgi:hypothetical protein
VANAGIFPENHQDEGWWRLLRENGGGTLSVTCLKNFGAVVKLEKFVKVCVGLIWGQDVVYECHEIGIIASDRNS